MALWYECGNGFAKTSLARKSAGWDAYICCPGPSLASVPVDRLKGRGCKVIALTTAYPRVIPDIWFGMDTPSCYDRNIWFESFMKICRSGNHNMAFQGVPASYFPEVYWADVAEPVTGNEIFSHREHDIKFVWYNNTLATALHVLVWMGVSHFHFIGCDMGGDPDYHDGRELKPEHRERNRALYSKQIDFLRKFVKAGVGAGVRCTSCTPDSPINEFMPFVDVDTALERTERRISYEGRNEVVYVLDKEDDPRPVALHIVNWAIWGGVQTCVVSIARGYPEYRHCILTVNSRGCDREVLKTYARLGIAHKFAEDNVVKMDDVALFNPSLVFLHNNIRQMIQQPDDWLMAYNSVFVFHGLVNAPHTRLNWAVSEYTRPSDRESFVLPPVLVTDDYRGIVRPERKPVVGRVQSQTQIGGNKYPDSFFALLEKLDCETFVVGPRSGGTRGGPIVVGAMAEYLENVDIFVIWGDTCETWSLAVSEANLSGIPVVARNMRDGLAEQLQKSGGGILVDTEDEFLQVVKQLVEDKELREQIGRAGQQWCMENMDVSLLKQHLVFDKPLVDSPLNLFFDRVFCVNLNDRVERLLTFDKLAGLHGIRYERVNAVDGRRMKGFGLKGGELGCLLSHISCLRIMLDRGIERLLVFEDDAAFVAGFDEKILKVLETCPADWDMLYFGGNPAAEKGRNLAASIVSPCNNLWNRHTGVLTTHAYAITAETAEKILPDLEKLDTPVDVVYHNWHKNLNVYMPKERLCFQRNVYSDIHEKYVAYHVLRDAR